MAIYECKTCNKEVKRKPSKVAASGNVYCSHACRGQIFTCETCGKTFKGRMGGPHRRNLFCSGDCRGKGFSKRAEGNRTLNQLGYILVHSPQHPNCNSAGRVLEHRLVMEESLGRYLTGDENVHHKNGDRSDNRLDNLELWNTSQPAGQRVEDKVKFAVEILSFYAPDFLVGA